MSVTILGLVSKKFHKKMIAFEGSEIFVSGTLGDAGIGLQIKKGQFSSLNKTVKNFFLSKLYKPIPEIKLGKSLIGIADFCKTEARIFMCPHDLHIIAISPNTRLFFSTISCIN